MCEFDSDEQAQIFMDSASPNHLLSYNKKEYGS